MRHFLILTGLLFVTGAVADEADFDFKSKKANIAIEKYQATIKKAKAVEKRNRVDLILALEAALKYERTEGELDEAIKIRDAIKALKKGASPAGGSKGRKRKARIPRDAVKYKGNYYKAIPLRGTHQAALNQCVENGGHLARIESKDEQNFIEKIIADSNESHWIDGSDAASEGQWMFSNGTPMQYFKWAPEEPSNWSGDTGAPQHFLTIYPESFTWDDKEPSRHLFPYICEWDGPAGSKQRAKKIPADAVKWNGHHYKVYAGGVPHSVAQKQCEMMGGHLARIQNPGEQRLSARLIANGKREGYWLDGSDVETEGLWKFSDGSAMKYFAWHPGEPNNSAGDRSGQHALRCYKNGSWDDDYEGARDVGFICEWDE